MSLKSVDDPDPGSIQKQAQTAHQLRAARQLRATPQRATRRRCPKCGVFLALTQHGRMWEHPRPIGSCPGRESVDHAHRKDMIQDAARAVGGCQAEQEVQDRVANRWQGDVVVMRPDGRLIDFEPQVSDITARDADDRRRRIESSRVELCWVISREWSGLAGHPRVLTDETPPYVVRKHVDLFDGKWWGHEPKCDLSGFVARLCLDELRWLDNRPFGMGPAWVSAADMMRALQLATLDAGMATQLQLDLGLGPSWADVYELHYEWMEHERRKDR